MGVANAYSIATTVVYKKWDGAVTVCKVGSICVSNKFAVFISGKYKYGN